MHRLTLNPRVSGDQPLNKQVRRSLDAEESPTRWVRRHWQREVSLHQGLCSYREPDAEQPQRGSNDHTRQTESKDNYLNSGSDAAAQGGLTENEN